MRCDKASLRPTHETTCLARILLYYFSSTRLTKVIEWMVGQSDGLGSPPILQTAKSPGYPVLGYETSPGPDPTKNHTFPKASQNSLSTPQALASPGEGLFFSKDPLSNLPFQKATLSPAPPGTARSSSCQSQGRFGTAFRSRPSSCRVRSATGNRAKRRFCRTFAEGSSSDAYGVRG